MSDHTAPTLGRPAPTFPTAPPTTEPVAYLDRDGDVWVPSSDDPQILLVIDRGYSASAEHITHVGGVYGPLVPLIREDVVAAREAAARAEGARSALTYSVESLTAHAATEGER